VGTSSHFSGMVRRHRSQSYRVSTRPDLLVAFNLEVCLFIEIMFSKMIRFDRMFIQGAF